MITSSRQVVAQAEAAGHLATLQAFGARLVTDTCWCMLDEPLVPPGARTLMTNSAKYAHYAPGPNRQRRRFLVQLVADFQPLGQRLYALGGWGAEQRAGQSDVAPHIEELEQPAALQHVAAVLPAQRRQAVLAAVAPERGDVLRAFPGEEFEAPARVRRQGQRQQVEQGGPDPRSDQGHLRADQPARPQRRHRSRPRRRGRTRLRSGRRRGAQPGPSRPGIGAADPEDDRRAASRRPRGGGHHDREPALQPGERGDRQPCRRKPGQRDPADRRDISPIRRVTLPRLSPARLAISTLSRL